MEAIDQGLGGGGGGGGVLRHLCGQPARPAPLIRGTAYFMLKSYELQVTSYTPISGATCT